VLNKTWKSLQVFKMRTGKYLTAWPITIKLSRELFKCFFMLITYSLLKRQQNCNNCMPLTVIFVNMCQEFNLFSDPVQLCLLVHLILMFMVWLLDMTWYLYVKLYPVFFHLFFTLSLSLFILFSLSRLSYSSFSGFPWLSFPLCYSG